MTTVERLRIAARDPLGQSMPRCAEAAPMADSFGVINGAPVAQFRSPQEHINAQQIEADEYAAAWRRALAFGAPLVGLALLAVLLIVTAVRAEDKLEADLTLYHQFRSMK